MIANFVRAWQEGQAEAGSDTVRLTGPVAIGAIIILAIAGLGGSMLYAPAVLIMWLAVGLIGVLVVAGADSNWFLPGAVVIISMGISAIANRDTIQYGAVVIAGATLAYIAYVIARQYSDVIEPAFLWAGRIYPAVAVALYLAGENRNVIGLLALFFAAVAIARRKWGLITLYGVGIVALGGRSAMMAFVIMLMVGYQLPRLWWISVGALGVFLMALRPETIAVRFDIWRMALQLWREHPIPGLGPGGFVHEFQQLISRYQINLAYSDKFIGYPRANALHTHNLLLQTLVEGGAVGLVALVISGWWLWRRWPGLALWQRLVVVGVLSAGVMDYPFMLPGVMMLFAISLARSCISR